jgi:hypothetical protein
MPMRLKSPQPLPALPKFSLESPFISVCYWVSQEQSKGCRRFPICLGDEQEVPQTGPFSLKVEKLLHCGKGVWNHRGVFTFFVWVALCSLIV